MLTISVQVLNGLTELCHLTTAPVLPDNVSNPLVLPVQTAEPPETDPPTEFGSTVTVAGTELSVGQVPL